MEVITKSHLDENSNKSQGYFPLKSTDFNPFGYDWTAYNEETIIYQYQQTTVLKKTNKQTGDSIAAKVIQRERLTDYDFNECTLLQRLNHPSVVQLLGYQSKETQVTIYIEYIDGETLTQFINRKKALYIQEAFKIYEQLLLVLKYFKEQNVAHLDLKPDNILITMKGQLKIIDFENSVITSQNNICNKLVGSFPYLAPEAMNSKEYCVDKFDLYSVHLIYINCLVGSMLWDKPIRSDEIYNSWVNSSSQKECANNSIFKYLDSDTYNYLKQVIIEDPVLRPDVDQVINSSYFLMMKLEF